MSKRKALEPRSCEDLATEIGQVRERMAKLADEMVDADEASLLGMMGAYDDLRRREFALVAMAEASRVRQEQAQIEAEQKRLRPLREEFERLEAITRPGFLDQALRERFFPALERLFLDLHELEAGIHKTIETQKAAAAKCRELAGQMGTTWGMGKPFTTVETVRHRGREYLEVVLRDTAGTHGEMAAWFPRAAAPRKVG